MAHFSYKSILCYLGWPVCKRNFVSFFHKILCSVGKSKSRSLASKNKKQRCIKTPEATTQYIQYGLPINLYYLRDRLRQEGISDALKSHDIN